MNHRISTLTPLLFALPLVVSPAAAQQGKPANAAEAAAQKAREVAELDAKYQAWVDTLTPERQAWERVLQAPIKLKVPIVDFLSGESGWKKLWNCEEELLYEV